MPRFILCCGLLLSLAGVCRAQTAPVPAASLPAAPAAPVYTRADSLDAVSALFAMKRAGGRWPLLLALPGLRLMAGTQRDYNVYTGHWEETPASGAAVAAGLGLMCAGLTFMLVRNSTYSMLTLLDLQTAHADGKSLPPAYRAQLRPRHFAKAAKWRGKYTRKAARYSR
ncbi:hypothetical protein SAMN02745146_2473 [Hymenobacter daecheongensis DSM 21074]|uniref:Uncharacterized protein n=1 Tax=Hymenobacter daecheongensis DSM 21074 TaxID=1121955 RepID=A0A1M6H0J5_9BACT|nr:hypothetical protein [Hymenobacter daecheongensis]SHJ15738.1 hypothetical protein SAMN02745146_2473 [Hymenobacter daecheongensis DSM 21074]